MRLLVTYHTGSGDGRPAPRLPLASLSLMMPEWQVITKPHSQGKLYTYKAMANMDRFSFELLVYALQLRPALLSRMPGSSIRGNCAWFNLSRSNGHFGRRPGFEVRFLTRTTPWREPNLARYERILKYYKAGVPETSRHLPTIRQLCERMKIRAFKEVRTLTAHIPRPA